jgi:23S rRNA pseudouridine2605 synthase
MNKPKGYVTTLHDPEKRPTVMDLLRGVKARVYPVGRLDYASEGLLLLTNDGEFANFLMKAASHVPKTYMVKVSGTPAPDHLDRLREGLTISTERAGKRVRTAPAQIKIIREGANPWYEVTLIEGKNRQIRRMFEEIGHHVEKIKRVRYGPLELDVHPGKFRQLTLKEVASLKAAAK